MLKKGLEYSSHENVFIRQALGDNIRLDGRGIRDYRDISIELSRDECRSESSVTLGATRVICIVNGEIVVPYPDRPTEGILQFNADISICTEQAGHTSSSICRMLERSIRDSEALDTESLCIIAAEKVWAITCEVRVLNYGGNVADACNLAVMGALRAFRKPEVSVSRLDMDMDPITTSRLLSSEARDSLPLSSSAEVKLHNTDEREPLPLALHHTPLSISFGVFAEIKSFQEGSEWKMVLVSDPTDEEERVMDGFIVYSVNAHGEVCAVLKPGGVGMSSDTVLAAANLALSRAPTLHSHLTSALTTLETNYQQTRGQRLETLRALRKEQVKYIAYVEGKKEGNGETMDVSDIADSVDGGIDIDDPILKYNFNHSAAPVGASD